MRFELIMGMLNDCVREIFDSDYEAVRRGGRQMAYIVCDTFAF